MAQVGFDYLTEDVLLCEEHFKSQSNMRKYTQPILYADGSEKPEGYLPVCSAFSEYTLWYDPDQVTEDDVIEMWDRYHEEEDTEWFWDEVHCI
jgi:GT2 family glycosyltransferase